MTDIRTTVKATLYKFLQMDSVILFANGAEQVNLARSKGLSKFISLVARLGIP